jgi:hypothetical protein
MILTLKRRASSSKATIGELFVNDSPERLCYTLEDVARELKIQDETCIPEGAYVVVIDKSNRFGRLMPHVLNVEGFEGIRIHYGNTDKDTEGCILVGLTLVSDDFISKSREAFSLLFAILNDAFTKGEKITLQIMKG